MDNYSGKSGGGLYFLKSSKVNLFNISLTNNIANEGNGGGIFAFESENIYL